jgi:hypothetical protein
MRVLCSIGLLSVLVCALAGCFSTPDSVQATLITPCHQGPVGPVLCEVNLVNLPTSHDPFKWTASSSVSGTLFVPASNTSPGISPDGTQTVAVSIPAGACPAMLTFTDSATSTSASLTFGNPCVTPAPIPTP